MPTPWDVLFEKQELATIDVVRDNIKEGCIEGEEFALLDRYDLGGTTWRKVIVRCQKDSTMGAQPVFTLLDEHGALLHEPPDCPQDGFSQESLLLDIGTEYYDVQQPAEQEEEDDGDGLDEEEEVVPAFPAELDNCRVRLTASARSAARCCMTCVRPTCTKASSSEQ